MARGCRQRHHSARPDPPDGVDLDDAEEIYRYVTLNAGDDEPERICSECIADTAHVGYFFSLTQHRLGERKAEAWLQNVVFRNIPIGNLMGSKAELDDESAETDSKDGPLKDSTLSGLFMRAFEDEIKDLIDKRRRWTQYKVDPEKVNDGFRDALERVFLAPSNGVQDERVTFFIQYPQHLGPNHALALNESGISMQSPEDMDEADRSKGYRSIYEASRRDMVGEDGEKYREQSDKKLRSYVREILSDFLEDNEDPSDDGLLSLMEQLIADKSEDLFEFFSWHLTWGTQRAQSQEGKNLSRLQNLPDDVAGGDGGRASVLGIDDVIRQDAELTDRQVVRQEAMGRDLVVKSVDAAEDLGTSIASEMRRLNASKLTAKLEGRTSITQSQALRLLLPDVLEMYMSAASDLVRSKATPNNFASAKELEKNESYAQWGRGSDSVLVARDGQICIKASPKSVDVFRQKVIDRKRRIQELAETNDTIEFIAEQTSYSKEFIEGTLSQFELFSKLPVLNRAKNGEEVKPSHIDTIKYLESMDASRVKNDFKHRWTAILNVAFKAEEDGGKRFYERFPVQARRAFAALLPPHPYIVKGTIPKSSAAWAWSTSRETGRSYVRMYYAFIGQAIPREVEDREKQFLEGYSAGKEE